MQRLYDTSYDDDDGGQMHASNFRQVSFYLECYANCNPRCYDQPSRAAIVDTICGDLHASHQDCS